MSIGYLALILAKLCHLSQNMISIGDWFHAVARVNEVSHVTMLQRLDGGKSTMESHERQQILTIVEEDVLA